MSDKSMRSNRPSKHGTYSPGSTSTRTRCRQPANFIRISPFIPVATSTHDSLVHGRNARTFHHMSFSTYDLDKPQSSPLENPAVLDLELEPHPLQLEIPHRYIIDILQIDVLSAIVSTWIPHGSEIAWQLPVELEYSNLPRRIAAKLQICAVGCNAGSGKAGSHRKQNWFEGMNTQKTHGGGGRSLARGKRYIGVRSKLKI